MQLQGRVRNQSNRSPSAAPAGATVTSDNDQVDPTGDCDPIPDSWGAYTARRLFEGHEPGYAYWEPPDEPWWSGWTVVVGDASPAAEEDASLFQINRLDTLRALHLRLAELFRGHVIDGG